MRIYRYYLFSVRARRRRMQIASASPDREKSTKRKPEPIYLKRGTKRGVLAVKCTDRLTRPVTNSFSRI